MAEYGGPSHLANQKDIELHYGDRLYVELVGERDPLAKDTPDREKWVARGLCNISVLIFSMKF